MKRIVLGLLGVIAVSTSALAQAPDPVTTAVLALPASLREGAMVIKWKPDFTYDTLKPGTNGMVCYDQSGFPLQRAFSMECTTVGNLKRTAQNLKAEATGDKAKSEAMLAAMEKDGTREKPEFGSVWYHYQGTDREHATTHMTIAVPGATSATMGLPDKRRQNGLWIMDAGTTTAHLMLPGQ